MTVFAVGAMALRVLLSAVLLAAALLKIASLRGLRVTLRSIVPAATVAPAIWGLITVELAGAVLVFSPRPGLAAASAVVPGSLFAFGGLRAMRSRATVHCNCFGSLRATVLGGRQIAQLPIWLGVGAVVLVAPSSLAIEQVAGVLAIELATLAAGGLIVLARFAGPARGDRVALEEVQRWLVSDVQ